MRSQGASPERRRDRSLRPADGVEGREALEGRQVAGVLAGGDALDDAAEDLAAAGLGQLGDEPHALGDEGLAQLVADAGAQLGSERLAGPVAGPGDDEAED